MSPSARATCSAPFGALLARIAGKRRERLRSDLDVLGVLAAGQRGGGDDRQRGIGAA